MCALFSSFVPNFDRLLKTARTKAESHRPRAALLFPDNIDALTAFLKASAEGIIDPLLIGDASALKKMLGGNIDPMKIEAASHPGEAIEVAMRLIDAGAVDLLAQGGGDGTRMILDALTANDSVFSPVSGLLSHVAVIKPTRYPRMLFVTDGLIHDEPNLKTKIALTANLVRVCKACGVTEPRTAAVTAVEAVYPQMPATVDGALMAKMSERGQIKGLKIDGPLSFDIAIDPVAADAKGIKHSEVAGRADALIASSRHVAAGIYQALSLFAECELGGVLVGGRIPVATSFRTDSIDTRFHSIVLATLLA